MSLTKEDLKNIKNLFSKRFDGIDKRLDKMDERLLSHELVFQKIYKKLDSIDSRIDRIDTNMISLASRECINSDRIDRLDLELDDLRRSSKGYCSVRDKK